MICFCSTDNSHCLIVCEFLSNLTTKTNSTGITRSTDTSRPIAISPLSLVVGIISGSVILVLLGCVIYAFTLPAIKEPAKKGWTKMKTRVKRSKAYRKYQMLRDRMRRTKSISGNVKDKSGQTDSMTRIRSSSNGQDIEMGAIESVTSSKSSNV